MSGRRPAPRPRRRPAPAGATGRGSLRVVAGEARGLRLAVPPGDATRPTSDRVREAVATMTIEGDVETFIQKMIGTQVLGLLLYRYGIEVKP